MCIRPFLLAVVLGLSSLFSFAQPGLPAAKEAPANWPRFRGPNGSCISAGKHLLSAYDFAGNLVWSQDRGEDASQHGVGASPVLFEDKVILMDDNDKTAAVLAFEAKTGKPAWRADRTAYRACYSTPLLHE